MTTSYDDDPDMDASARCAHTEQRDEMIEARSKRDPSNPSYLSAGHEWRFDPKRRRYVCAHCRAEGILDLAEDVEKRGGAKPCQGPTS